MPHEQTVEQRLAALEKEVAELKERLERVEPANWLDRVAGCMEKYPEFGEVIKYGAEIRKADRPRDEP